ncbi:GNAT family N-acetyltransferase [Alsobacter sp. SYSU M60028]|uniref:GNAT family N-acetyltransferase n=1 Tax=Alsobacter ponti TaxID=2962936 RepID=A0ABT1LAU2_9HYPH|nr:GNAT family N-acetyltransferase [Alsobacter ponti]MCP8938612.1 GNAT family N-acetyltransferase [Alsobacter ponti]
MWPRLFPSRPPSVRPLGGGDASRVAAIHAQGFAHAWSAAELEAMLLDPAVVAQGIGAGQALDGFVLSRRAADEAEILTVAVTKSARGRGLAGELLRHHLGRLATLGVRALFLEVDEGNAPARRLYDRLGFAEVGRRAAYYRKPDGGAATALVLRRDVP